MLNQHGNSGGVTCGDCYFRQELLCALQTERVCPTFRATVGRAPVRPRQAQLMPVPVPMLAGVGGQETWPAPGITAMARGGATVVAEPAPAASMDAPRAAPAQEPSTPPAVQLRDAIRARARAVAAETSEPVFGSTSEEANFSVRDAGDEPDDDIVTAREAADPRPALRAAASRMDFANEVIVEVGAPVAETYSQSRTSGGRDSSRADRIARRIAQRYPNALHGR